jgi:branched-chain amino acid transport system ATP-binding protein
MIEVEDLVVRYGQSTALDHVSLRVDEGEMVALIGPNGAGKSTLVNTLSGILRPASGKVRISGRLAQVPEGRHLFRGLTVEDNLRLGAWRTRRTRRGGRGGWSGRGGGDKRDRDVEQVYEVLPGLRDLRTRRAETLSGGEQQMVAVGRALMARPDVIAVDELSLGLAPTIVADLAGHLAELNASRGLAVLLIEQNARLAFDLCRRAYVLEAGRVAAEGPCRELSEDPSVAGAYLGGAP